METCQMYAFFIKLYENFIQNRLLGFVALPYQNNEIYFKLFSYLTTIHIAQVNKWFLWSYSFSKSKHSSKVLCMGVGALMLSTVKFEMSLKTQWNDEGFFQRHTHA